MTETTRRFYTFAEVIDALRLAFAQYPSQLHMLTLIWPMVFGDSAYLIIDSPQRGIWAKRPGCKKPYLADEATLKIQIVDHLLHMAPRPAQLAAICLHVFGTPAIAGVGPEAATAPGIWIETDMGGFVCTRCGHCCRTLDYTNGCTVEDYRRWKASGREDILQWVGTVRRDGRVVACRIWMVPGTNQFAETCPWLKPDTIPGRTRCAIHAVRPMVCRHYPGSRKHARLTGCRGV
jgi:Fe-S-cluster containining protein